jgi:hypothetical protein
MKLCQILLGAIAFLSAQWPQPAAALPPAEDTPEEVLRTEIFLEARSPLTGQPLTAAEYARLQEELRSDESAILSADIRQIIFLLQLRRVLRPVLPLLP